MRYLSDNVEGRDWRSVKTPGNWILEFSLQDEDYFLNYRMVWKEIECNIYRFIVDGHTIEVPSGHYVMIGDETGEIDWLLVDEMIGRPLDLVYINEEQSKWKIGRPKFDFIDSGVVYWPNTQNIVPVYNGNCGILMSDKDQHKRTKDEYISLFIV